MRTTDRLTRRDRDEQGDTLERDIAYAAGILEVAARLQFRRPPRNRSTVRVTIALPAHGDVETAVEILRTIAGGGYMFLRSSERGRNARRAFVVAGIAAARLLRSCAPRATVRGREFLEAVRIYEMDRGDTAAPEAIAAFRRNFALRGRRQLRPLELPPDD